MKVIVCGAGQVGSSIARYLSQEGNDVTVIDHQPELTRKISETLDVKAVTGYASHPAVLEMAGANDAELLVAVTYSDEVNMVACQVGHLFNITTKIARIRQQGYLDAKWSDLYTRDSFPIDVVISPEREVAKAIARRLDVPGAFDLISLAGDKVKLAGVRLGENCPVIKTPLRQLTQLFPDLNVVIVVVARGQRTFIPGADDQLEVGDEIYFVVDSRHLERAMAAFGHEENLARRIVIFGGGNIGEFLACQVEQEHPSVNLKVVERDRGRAEMVARALRHSVVLQGDVLDAEIMEQANVAAAETVIAVTNDDETNILASLLAKRQGSKRAITLVNSDTYAPLIPSLGVDALVGPRSITVSSILAYVRRGRIHSVHTLRDGFGELIEAEAIETSSLVGRPLREVGLPDEVIVGAVVRGDQVIMPRGSTIIEKGDRVVIFAEADTVRQVEKMFSVRLEYF
jgi:trk system potassium uptake protein